MNRKHIILTVIITALALGTLANFMGDDTAPTPEASTTTEAPTTTVAPTTTTRYIPPTTTTRYISPEEMFLDQASGLSIYTTSAEMLELADSICTLGLELGYDGALEEIARVMVENDYPEELAPEFGDFIRMSLDYCAPSVDYPAPNAF